MTNVQLIDDLRQVRRAAAGAHDWPMDQAQETDRLLIRRVRPADAAALGEFYAGLSPESRRARFLGFGRGISEEQSLSFCTPDHLHAEGFLALRSSEEGRAERLIGHLCLEPISQRRCELALAVADAEQGRGVGRALFKAALRWLASHGYREIVASAFADNARVLRLLSSAPLPARISPAAGGLVDVVVPLVQPLPADVSLQPLTSRQLRRRRQARSTRAIRPCRAVWRRMPRPGLGAAGSASKESS